MRRLTASFARVVEPLPLVADSVPLGVTTATVTVEPRAPEGGGAVSPRLLIVFSLAAVGAGAGRALTTTYLPVLLERIDDAPTLIGAVMTVNAVAGFAIPIAIGVWSDRRGRRLPFIAGGAVVTAGGLVAIGLGNGTSYLALAARRGARLHRPERADDRPPRDRGGRRRGRPPARRDERAGGRRADRRRASRSRSAAR